MVIRDSSGTALTTLNAATGTTTQLAATAAYNHISLKADLEAFTWEVTGDIGTVDEHGLFTAAAPGTGTITVSAGPGQSLHPRHRLQLRHGLRRRRHGGGVL